MNINFMRKYSSLGFIIKKEPYKHTYGFDGFIEPKILHRTSSVFFFFIATLPILVDWHEFAVRQVMDRWDWWIMVKKEI